MDDLDQKAREALQKKASFGVDIDVAQFSREAEAYEYREELTGLPKPDVEQMLRTGIDITERERSGTFIQMDHSVVHSKTHQEGLEVLNVTEALERYNWLEDYWWKAVSVDTDKYTATAHLHQTHGYFIRSLPGVKSIFPVQACLYLSQEGIAQNVHNIIIAEEGSELHIITGCAISAGLRSGLHLGVSEFYVKKGARISFTMIHNWAEEMMVRPRTGTIVEEDGLFLSNYMCMRAVKSLQMYPTARLVGPGAVARYNTILVGLPGSDMDVGSRVILEQPHTRAEVVARTISTGGRIVARGHLVGLAPEVKSHLECRGLILSEEGTIIAIPELEGQVAGVDMSHEAAVGKIAQEEIEYLMARGLDQDQATAAIVRGFLNVEIVGLPPQLREELDRAISQSQEEIF